MDDEPVERQKHHGLIEPAVLQEGRLDDHDEQAQLHADRHELEQAGAVRRHRFHPFQDVAAAKRQIHRRPYEHQGQADPEGDGLP